MGAPSLDPSADFPWQHSWGRGWAGAAPAVARSAPLSWRRRHSAARLAAAFVSLLFSSTCVGPLLGWGAIALRPIAGPSPPFFSVTHVFLLIRPSLERNPCDTHQIMSGPKSGGVERKG